MDLRKFQERYENQYDLTHDPLYNKWPSIHHPEAMERVSPTQLIFYSDDDYASLQQVEGACMRDHEYDTSLHIWRNTK